MGLRGPKSEKHLAFAEVLPERPKPPAGMSARARRTWKQIVETHAPGFFRQGSLHLLRAFCEADALHYEATADIAKFGKYIELKSGEEKVHPAVKIQTQKSLEMSGLATKLRLAVSSYRDRDVAGREGREQPKSKRAGLMFGES